jgi:hypothetical protein
MCLFYETGIHNYRKTHFTENSYGTRNPWQAIRATVFLEPTSHYIICWWSTHHQNVDEYE